MTVSRYKLETETVMNLALYEYTKIVLFTHILLFKIK